MNDRAKKIIKFRLPVMGRVICVACMCALIVSAAGCQILINAVAGNLAAESIKKGSAGADRDKKAYQATETPEQHYQQSQFWEKEGYLEYAITEIEKFIELAPDDPRGPERLHMLEAKLKKEKEMAVSPASTSPE